MNGEDSPYLSTCRQMAATKPLLKESLFLLNVFGVNLVKQTLWGYVRIAVTMVIANVLLVEMLLDLIFNWRGVDSLYNLSMFAGVYQLISKLYVTVINRRKFVKLLHIINKFWQTNEFHEEAEKLYHLTKQFLKFTTIIGCIFIIGFYSFSLFFRQIPLETYHPFNPLKSPNYEFLWCFELSFAATIFCPYFAFEYLFISLVIYVFVEFKIVKKKIISLPGEYERNENLRENFRKIGLIIEQHNLVLRFIKEMNDIYSLMILNHFFSSLFVISTSMTGIVIKGFADLSEFSKLALFVVHFSGQLLVYCVGGEVIMISCEAVSDAILEADWWLLEDPKLNKALVLMIQRSQKMEKVSAVGMFDLNLESFAKVVNTAFSFFTVFKAVYKTDSL